ncbi:MAG: acetolactate synthase small subunit [Rhodothermales bacterium]|nr:acetolactate synthase small subunit [Rhodothermales bacterium]MCA0270040.1 acetolactate synthase small subunit [Bacteroidota bacterium]
MTNAAPLPASRAAASPSADERRVLAVRLENHAGALNRVANLFSQRGFNLDSVTVSPTEDPTVSRMTLTTSGSPRQMEQAIAQVKNLVDVLAVDDLTSAEHVERELCLVRVHYTPETRSELVDLIGFYKGIVVDVRPETLVIELSGPVAKINQFVAHVARFGVTDVARSGRVAMRREIVYGD